MVHVGGNLLGFTNVHDNGCPLILVCFNAFFTLWIAPLHLWYFLDWCLWESVAIIVGPEVTLHMHGEAGTSDCIKILLYLEAPQKKSIGPYPH